MWFILHATTEKTRLGLEAQRKHSPVREDMAFMNSMGTVGLVPQHGACSTSDPWDCFNVGLWCRQEVKIMNKTDWVQR